MGTMSLLEQIKCIEQMRSNLEQLCNDFVKSYTEFADDIQFLRSNGLPIEIADKYSKEYYEPIFIQLENLKSNFMYKHYPYLTWKKEKLKDVILYKDGINGIPY